jgi:hypothetical protein
MAIERCGVWLYDSIIIEQSELGLLGSKVGWLSSLRGSGVTWYWVSVSWPANMAG